MEFYGRNSLLLILLFLALGCASSDGSQYTDDYRPEPEDLKVGLGHRERHPASLEMNNFTISKVRQKRPNAAEGAGPTQFFHKSCENSNQGAYYTRHSYFCESR